MRNFSAPLTGNVYYIPDEQRYLIIAQITRKGNSMTRITSERLPMFHRGSFMWYVSANNAIRYIDNSTHEYVGRLELNLDTVTDMYTRGSDEAAQLANDMLSRAVLELRQTEPLDSPDDNLNYEYY